MGAARNGRKNEREGQHREFYKCEVHIDSRTCREVERMNRRYNLPLDWDEITSSSGVMSGTEGTQYGIKVFNAQDTICYTESHPVNPFKRE